MELKGLEIFNLTEEEALKFVKEFEILKNEKGDYEAMNYLFSEALDFSSYHKNIMMNAWRALIEISKNVKETMN